MATDFETVEKVNANALAQNADQAELESVLASHPLINTDDFIAPNTLTFSD